jgi:spore maturation protein CgeB
VYPGSRDGLRAAAHRAADADIVVKASGVGFEDDALLAAVMEAARGDALTVWWDVDAPATLAEMGASAQHPLRARLGDLDLVLTYGGGPPAVQAYRAFGAARCVPIYNALDPATHFPVQADARFAADLGFLGNRLPDREQRVESFFLDTAARLPERAFLLGGAGWEDKPKPANVNAVGHVGTADHNAFNATPTAVLNINRASMAETGYSPPTRIFEAAGAGGCLITDAWTGIDLFLKPGEEILVARDGQDVAEILRGLTPAMARTVGARALRRVRSDHTYDRRCAEVDRLLRQSLAAKRAGAAA